MASLPTPKSELIHSLQSRGFLYQCTDIAELDKRAASGPITAYCGYDATAESLHIGNLMTIMVLRWIQKTGHRPIALLGGGTTKVGDPSGKDETRKLLDDKAIRSNAASFKNTLQALLTFDESENKALIANNADWLDSLSYISFLRDVGRHFTVNRMLTMDSVKLRLDREQPLTFLEFNYMVLQSYDFVELNKRYDCTLQVGGSDQWGNIVTGVDLGRRMANAELFGLTCPLITTSSGAKMGKTANGAVWLKAAKMSPYDYFQYWRNTEDMDVGRFLKLFTYLPLDEIDRLAALKGGEINVAKKRLAFEATSILHGPKAAKAALETAEKTFESGELGEDLPRLEVPSSQMADGVTIVDLLTNAGLCKSKGEARRLIKGGGAKINDERIEDETYTLKESDTVSGSAKISAGKKHHAVVLIV